MLSFNFKIFIWDNKIKTHLDYLYSPDLKNQVVQVLPFNNLIVLNRKAGIPIYLQISNRLINLIREGILKPGSSLPSSRQLAFQLKVHRKTIVAAYEELYAQDWIETVPRKGITVSQLLPEMKPRTFKAVSKKSGYKNNAGFIFRAKTPLSQPIYAGAHRLIINDGFPDARIAPIGPLLKEYRRLFQLPAARRRGMYGDQAGSFSLRKAITAFLSTTRGLNHTTDNILITHGAQMAIYLAAAMILEPGSDVIVGEPNYFMANMIFGQFGARLIKIPVDENGIDVQAIGKICKRKRPALLYIIPHHHHPTTVTLSADRRMHLLQVIREYNLPVIEDDYDYDFHYSSSPILPLASADHGGNVIYIGSVAKTLATSFRVGYMVAPENFIQASAQLRKLIDIRGDDLLEEALGILFSNGSMQRHLKKSLKLYHSRRDMFCDLLQFELKDRVSFSKPAGGMAVWATFDKKFPLSVIAKKASAKGLYISNGSIYNTGNINLNSVRMGFASLNENEMTESVHILKSLMQVI